MTPTIRYLIWDTGGVLFDTYPAAVACMRRALQELGRETPGYEPPSPAIVRELFATSTSHTVSTLAQRYGVDGEALERRYRAYYRAFDPAYQPPFPALEEVCRYVRESGGQNFIVTHRGQATLLPLLEAHNLKRYFTRWLTKDEGYPRKPDPAAMEALIREYELERAQCMAIGDRDIDLLAGQRAGIHTCYFGTQHHEVRADLEIAHFATLLRWLQTPPT